MNAYFAQDVIDHRHTELLARAEQSRRYHAARENRTSAKSGQATPRIGAVRRPLAAMHAWLVAGVL